MPWDARPARFVMPGPLAPRLALACHPRPSGAPPCPGLSPLAHWRPWSIGASGPLAPRPAPARPTRFSDASPGPGSPARHRFTRFAPPGPPGCPAQLWDAQPSQNYPLASGCPGTPRLASGNATRPGMFSPASACHGSPRPGTPAVVPPGPALPPSPGSPLPAWPRVTPNAPRPRGASALWHIGAVARRSTPWLLLWPWCPDLPSCPSSCRRDARFLTRPAGSAPPEGPDPRLPLPGPV